MWLPASEGSLARYQNITGVAYSAEKIADDADIGSSLSCVGSFENDVDKRERYKMSSCSCFRSTQQIIKKREV